MLLAFAAIHGNSFGNFADFLLFAPSNSKLMNRLKFTLIFFVALIANKVSAQNSILWEVSGNGLKAPSYVLGTLKFIGEKEFFLPSEVKDRMKACQLFAIEDQIDHKAQHELSKAVHFPSKQSLSTQLKPEDYKLVQEFFQKEFGITKEHFAKQYARLIPLALSITMTRLSLGEKVKYYDIELLLLAKENKLDTYSLESVKREAQALQRFPMNDQVTALLHSINNFEVQKQEYKNLEAAYIEGDLDKVYTYTLHPTENNSIFIEEFYTKRNLEWFPKIEKMMNDKASFIAIGVSHLEGDSGILNLLTKKGYSLKPIAVRK